MNTKVGDRVLFPRRPSSPGGEFSVQIEGEMYILMHEEQSAFAVVEAEESLELAGTSRELRG